MSRFLSDYPADLADWERDERLVSRGFTHPWRSDVAAANGEAFFDALVRDSLRPGAVVLDVGCGHGAYAMSLAAACPDGRVIGVDRDARVLDLARELAAEREVSNVEFLVGEPSAELEIADRSVDLFVCRRGPVIGKWLPLAQRVAKPGAYAIGMHPTGAAGAVPGWQDELPEQLRRIERVFGYEEVREWVTGGLAGSRATLQSCWWFDVPETFDDPGQLASKLGLVFTGDPNELIQGELTALLDRHAGKVELRHTRLVWRVDLGIE
ncbi:class I SAM-dependent methyltransferase [Flindersiella endophytica]